MRADERSADTQAVPIEDVQYAVDALFAYLRDILYAPRHASLVPGELPEQFRDLADGMLFIGQCINESRDLASDLARGYLDSPKISPDNNLASGLKNLQSTLKHISWQVGQVAKGDYSQRVSFAGILSDSINDMIAQLKERDEALHAEILLNQQMVAEAHNTALLLESVTKSIAELIVVVDRTNHEWLYTNHEVSNYVPNQESAEELKEILNYKIDDYGKEKESAGTEQSEPLQSLIELMGEDGSLCQYFSVVGYPITWMEHKSIVLLLVDVTEEQRERMQLEQVAYYDTLTKTYSRHYGMKTLERWVAEKRTLVIAFVDMDGLKYVNDTFGHAAGDEYILATSELLRSFDSDAIICRLGGDEFMLLARSSTTSQAREKLELMRIQLAQGFEGAYERSFSFGLVEVDATNTKSASLLLSMADENMYEDKRSRKKERRAQV